MARTRTNQLDPLLTMAEVARHVGWKSTKTVERKIDAGEIEAFKVRGTTRVPLSALERYIAANMTLADIVDDDDPDELVS